MSRSSRPTYRAIREDERDGAAGLMMLAFGNPALAAEYAPRTRAAEWRVLEAGGEITSLLRESRQAQWWLGRRLPSAQVLQFATAPEHRALGLGAELLRRYLAELHADGVPTAVLRPSTARFYRGVGFEFAGAWNVYEARCEHLPRSVEPYRVRRLALDAIAPARAVYDRLAPSRHGAFARDEGWWRRFTRVDTSHPCTGFLLEAPGGAPAGWAFVQFGPADWAPGEPWLNRIEVYDWGCDPGADRALLAVLAGYGPVGGLVNWSGPDPDPALYLLGDERVRLAERRYWMLRLVDLVAAFQGRPYPGALAGGVAFEVDDPVCPWNSGAWQLELAGGQAALTSAPAAAASAGVRGLAALFTGFAGPDVLAAAGLLSGFDAAGLELLRAAFAGPRPWTAEFY